MQIISSQIQKSSPSPKDVTNPGAGRDLDPSAAHPGLEAQLQVLTAPDLHAWGQVMSVVYWYDFFRFYIHTFL
jgi:hypothetical protein